MMALDLTKEFLPLAKKCRDALYGQTPTEFEYPYPEAEGPDWAKNETRQNKQTLTNLLVNGANIYLIWVSDPGKASWVAHYIGKSEPDLIRQRLRNHLFKKSEKTGSKLAEVQQAVREGKSIGITVIRVIPDALRGAVEEQVMDLETQSGTPLLWNIHGNR